ncbi:MAG: putative beta-lysine N-acetyltransferase [Desulfovibrionales bacterium]
MAPDLIEHLGDSLIQHGKGSDRIYLMKLKDPDPSGIIEDLEELAEEHDYSKIFAKIPARAQEDFLEAGYEIEARVPKFFAGREDGLFLGKFLSEWRREDEAEEVIDKVLQTSFEKAEGTGLKQLSGDARVREMTPADAPDMAALYRKVFSTYPFPIFDPGYLEETMHSHIRYFGVVRSGAIQALASSETDPAQKNVEMTDFATHTSEQGKGLACILLRHMEDAMRKDGFATAYTIARAESFGMNIAFARCGYDFGGTLTNNTNIGGSLESMNVWFKPLDAGR